MIMRIGALSILAACASQPEPVDPGPMGAVQHRKSAEYHDEESKKHEGRYQPGAVDWRTRVDPYQAEIDGFPSYFFNPTDEHLAHAQRHRDHAAAHAAAAQRLEEVKAEACSAFREAEQRQCPLVGSIASILDIERGVRLAIREGVDPKGLTAHVRCHVAVGRLAGDREMADCPLYLPGIRVQQPAPSVIEVTTTDGTVIEALKHRMKRHASWQRP